MKAFSRYTILLFLAIVSLSLYIPQRYQTPYPAALGPELDTYIRKLYKNALEEEHFELVLLGDSTLNYAVDASLVEQELQIKTLNISLPGTAATLWYLIIKNNIAVANHKPAYLVLLIRDSVMTVPKYRTTGTYFNLIDEFASPKDTTLIEKAYVNQMSFLEKIAGTYLPIYSSRWRIRETIDYYLRYSVNKAFFNCNKDCVLKAMEDYFTGADIDEKHLTGALFAADTLLYQREALDFEHSVSDSFLPDIIQTTQENKIQLVLIKIPTRRFIDKNEVPPALGSYFTDMEKYLNDNGVTYLDLSKIPEITPDDFIDDLHMSEHGQKIFTPILIDQLQKILQ